MKLTSTCALARCRCGGGPSGGQIEDVSDGGFTDTKYEDRFLTGSTGTASCG
jgi:hypothetical protein